MQNLMTVRLPAVVVVVVVALPMAVATVVVEPRHRCVLIKSTVVLVRQRLLLSVQRQQLLWWRKWLLNRLLRKSLPRLLQSRRCLQAVPVVVVQRQADRAKIPLSLLISPIGSVESVGLLIAGWT